MAVERLSVSSGERCDTDPDGRRHAGDAAHPEDATGGADRRRPRRRGALGHE